MFVNPALEERAHTVQKSRAQNYTPIFIEFKLSANALKANEIYFTIMHHKAHILNYSSVNSTERRKEFICLIFLNILGLGQAKEEF